ncbi:hypothetical protein X777_14614 [Ooceraea biroi]|uniref:Uncharacterized protein n=1 Tax=Ooceraea biroi TaxID=2015173 RepID=A0A026WXP9_OOCBI|nr:hypothetical protein X777_14614 [Ooceraea biroi]
MGGKAQRSGAFHGYRAAGSLIKWSVPYLNLVPYARAVLVLRNGDTKPWERQDVGTSARIYDPGSSGRLNRYLDFVVAGVGQVSNGAGHGLYRGLPLALTTLGAETSIMRNSIRLPYARGRSSVHRARFSQSSEICRDERMKHAPTSRGNVLQRHEEAST